MTQRLFTLMLKISQISSLLRPSTSRSVKALTVRCGKGDKQSLNTFQKSLRSINSAGVACHSFGRVIVVPMTLPWLRSLEKLAVLRAFVRFFAEWSLTNGAPKMIDDLVLQNPDQPGALRATPFKFS